MIYICLLLPNTYLLVCPMDAVVTNAVFSGIVCSLRNLIQGLRPKTLVLIDPFVNKDNEFLIILN